MLNKIVLASFILASSSAYALAQQQAPPDVAFMQRAIGALQTQRNAALDAAAVSEARASGNSADLAKAANDLAKANARIKELEDKLSLSEENKAKE